MALGRGQVYTGTANEQRLLPVSLPRSRAKVNRTGVWVKVTARTIRQGSRPAAGAPGAALPWESVEMMLSEEQGERGGFVPGESPSRLDGRHPGSPSRAHLPTIHCHLWPSVPPTPGASATCTLTYARCGRAACSVSVSTTPRAPTAASARGTSAPGPGAPAPTCRCPTALPTRVRTPHLALAGEAAVSPALHRGSCGSHAHVHYLHEHMLARTRTDVRANVCTSTSVRACAHSHPLLHGTPASCDT